MIDIIVVVRVGIKRGESMYTEEEAKKKICPLPEMNHCLVSECMMWRWNPAYGYEGTKDDPIYSHGFCGLAGKP